MQYPGYNSDQDHLEIYLKAPTPFIAANWKQLLPGWQVQPKGMAIILLKSQFSLNLEDQEIEQEKERLLGIFLTMGEQLIKQSKKNGFLAEVISPKDGKPVYSTPGKLNFDLVAVVNYSLGFSFSQTVKGCKMLQHPRWNNDLYPGLLLSETTTKELQLLLKN